MDASACRGSTVSVSAHLYCPTLRHALVAMHAVPREEVAWFVYRHLFPSRTRLWRNLRLLMGGDPFDVQFAFAHQLLDACSPADVERLLRAHQMVASRRNRFAILLLGCRPDQARVVDFFSRAMGACTAGATKSGMGTTPAQLNPA